MEVIGKKITKKSLDSNLFPVILTIHTDYMKVDSKKPEYLRFSRGFELPSFAVSVVLIRFQPTWVRWKAEYYIFMKNKFETKKNFFRGEKIF